MSARTRAAAAAGLIVASPFAAAEPFQLIQEYTLFRSGSDPALLNGASVRVAVGGNTTLAPTSVSTGISGSSSATWQGLTQQVSITNRPAGQPDLFFAINTFINVANRFGSNTNNDQINTDSRTASSSLTGLSDDLRIPGVTINLGSRDVFGGTGVPGLNVFQDLPPDLDAFPFGAQLGPFESEDFVFYTPVGLRVSQTFNRSDFNHDGSVDVFDLIDFLVAFADES